MSSVDHGPFVGWLKELLEKGTGRPIGDTVAPVVNPNKSDFPYSVIFEIPGGNTWGSPLVAPEENADLIFQVTSYGLRMDSARFQADAVRRTIVARDPITGLFQVTLEDPRPWRVADRGSVGAAPPTPSETQYTPEVYTFHERFAIRVTRGD